MLISSASPGRRGLQAAVASIKVRSALAAAAVVAVAVLAGATVLVALLQRSLLASAEAGARTQAVQAAAQVLGVESLTGLSGELADTVTTGQVVQVLDLEGRVVAASGSRADSTPLSDLRPAPGQVLVRPVSRLQVLDPDGGFLVVARGVVRGDTRYVVIVATSVVAQEETAARLGVFLFSGSPVLVLVVAGATYLFVSRSLRPVERIRRRVEAIGAGRLTDRVPVPASGDEVALLAETMNGMLDRLQVSQEAQRRFVADASHELRSPLATLRATLDVSAAEGDRAALDEHLATLDAETERMRRLVDDLLLLAKADERGLRLARTDVDLDDLVSAEARRLRTTTTLSVDQQVQALRCTGDPARLARVVRNLTDNAARHARSRIGLTLSSEERDAVLVVDDDGPGVGPQDRERVFDRFVRLDASRERSQGGSGLGLAIAAEIVAGHGGSIAASTSAWGGARFTVRLPLGYSPAEVTDTAHET